MIAHSGIGTYMRNVIPRLLRASPSWSFTLIGDPESLGFLSAATNVRIVECGAPIYSIREQFEVPNALPRDATLLWVPHYNMPLRSPLPAVVTVHDMAHLRLPEYRASFARRTYARWMFRSVRNRAAAVMFASEFTRREFNHLAGEPRGVSEVVHYGVGPEWFEPENGAPSPPVPPPYFVYVGSLKPHKNVAALVAAFREVTRQMDARLIIIGRSENLRTPDGSLLSGLGSVANVSVLGEIASEAVRRHVRNATALVLPSFYEGFGFPPLEAMAAGCPAIVSRVASLPEVCGESALYFDPHDVPGLAALMLQVARDAPTREGMISRGRAHARRFDWSTTTEKVRHVLAGVLAKSPVVA
jgi:glycosyltransferase involved in cell wall biosynthesis